MSHMWLRYHRLHLLPFDRQVARPGADGQHRLRHLTRPRRLLPSSASATQFLKPFYDPTRASSALSPRASLAYSRSSLTHLPARLLNLPLLDSTARVHLRHADQHIAVILPSVARDRCDGELVGDMYGLVSTCKRCAVKSAWWRVDRAAQCCLGLCPRRRSVSWSAAWPPLRRLKSHHVDGEVESTSGDDGPCVGRQRLWSVELGFHVSDSWLPFSPLSCSLLHLGHRLFVCAVVRCCQDGSWCTELDSVSCWSGASAGRC